MNWEVDFLKYIIDNIHNDFMTEVMTVITSLGNYGFIWILITLIFLFIPKKREMGICMALSLVCIFIIVNVIMKPLIDRARPFEISADILNSIIISLPKDGSFPSGHTATAFAAATSLFCCNKKYGIILFVFAVIMGISRMYFAVHFPTDVLAGVIIGGATGLVSYKVYKKLKRS